MFTVESLRKAAGKVIQTSLNEFSKPKEFVSALDAFHTIWASHDCQHYREIYGKVVFAAPGTDAEKDARFSMYMSFLQRGYELNAYAVAPLMTKCFSFLTAEMRADLCSRLISVAGAVYTLTDVIQRTEKALDAAFVP